MRCEHGQAILPLTWHGALGSWEGQGGPRALYRLAAQPTMAEMVSAPAGTSCLGFHLLFSMGWYKISSQSLEDSPAASSQAELRKKGVMPAHVLGEGWEGRGLICHGCCMVMEGKGWAQGLCSHLLGDAGAGVHVEPPSTAVCVEKREQGK